ncbi:glycosyltransferase family 4 protein [Candidatus Pelagibacter sp. HIMB1587]|uniref:glycosyltransferase family 4 protein n=1 Tax=Candidatus Pelagibacter sp. HIMB1587 TaxID=3413354 RepID=UPI003F83C815
MISTITIFLLVNIIILFLSGKISYKLKLVDLPNKRKIHSKATAYTGGITLSIIFLFSIFLFDSFNPNLSLILSIGFLISVVGLIDDKYNLNTGGKLSLQIIPIFYLIFFENFSLAEIGNYGLFILDLGVFSIPFTFLSVLFLINAFNYFDGIDGILSFTTISTLSILYFLVVQENHYLVRDQSTEFFLAIITLSIIIFLLFNFSILKLPKIFLGDSGSLLLGFVISFILIFFANENLIHPILLAWSVAIFVYEFLSINIIRIKNNQKLFKPGQDHLHHILFRKTKSTLATNFLITLLNITFFAFGYMSYIFFNELISLLLFIILFLIFLLFRNIYSRKTFN